MSLHQFFLDKQIIANEDNQLDFVLDFAREDAKHIKALRLNIGEQIAVIDAAQNYYVCEILRIDGSEYSVKVSERGDVATLPYELALVAGIGKQGKLDDVIRAATEIGVGRFMPYTSSRTIVQLDQKRAASRQERWSAIARSAAMQSGQMCIPSVDLPADLLEVAKTLDEFDALLIFWEEAPSDATLKKALAHLPQKEFLKVAYVVGPEGGLSQVEVEALQASNKNSYLVCLGSTILRTETAGVVTSALCAYELGGLGAGKSEGA
jgi:16S rRNA (uracil1498-N3)-methyltransferase